MMIIFLMLVAIIATKAILCFMQYLQEKHYSLIIQWETVEKDKPICNKYVLFIFVYGVILLANYVFDGILIQKILVTALLLVLVQIWFMDIKYRFIFDESINFLFCINILVVLFEHSSFMDFVYRIITMGICFLIMLILAIILRGGLGGGDVKLVAVMAFLLSVEKIIAMLMIAFILGGIVAVFLLLVKKRSKKDYIAYGPYLIIGAIIQLFC